MRRAVHRPGFIPLLIFAVLAIELAAAAWLMAADREGVTVAGIPWDMKCAFKERFGVPCPACGMTRRVVLTLHGQVTTAAQLNPGGPMLVFGAAGFSAMMLWLGLREWLRPGDDFARMKQYIRWGTATVGMGLIAVVGMHWIRVLVLLH
jgi:hypothetical protein